MGKLQRDKLNLYERANLPVITGKDVLVAWIIALIVLSSFALSA